MAKARVPSPKTAAYIKHLAGEGLQHPSTLNAEQVRELAASVMAHIEPRANNKLQSAADRRYGKKTPSR